jgi:hypothetical protein
MSMIVNACQYIHPSDILRSLKYLFATLNSIRTAVVFSALQAILEECRSAFVEVPGGWRVDFGVDLGCYDQIWI